MSLALKNLMNRQFKHCNRLIMERPGLLHLVSLPHLEGITERADVPVTLRSISLAQRKEKDEVILIGFVLQC